MPAGFVRREGLAQVQTIIKGGLGFGYIPAATDSEAPVMRTVYGAPPEEDVRTKTVYGDPAAKAAEAEPEASDTGVQTEEAGSAEPVGIEDLFDDQPVEEPQESADLVNVKEAEIERARLIEEYEQLRDKYEREAEGYVIRAKEKANEIYEKTKEMANKTIAEAREEAEQIKAQAAEDGRRLGHDEGFQQGHEEGYVSALKKCRETLLKLKQLSESVTEHKEQMFLEYEHALFDSIFEIAQKVTINNLKQKDKAAITKMLRAAAKRYRSSKSVKITLSQLDISDEAEIDDELLKDIFSEGTLVEVEVLKDAPQGTLLIDNGAEITDAGVQTQLKMIEQLGKRKYRDKSLTDLLQAKRDRPQTEEAEDEGDDEEQ